MGSSQSSNKSDSFSIDPSGNIIPRRSAPSSSRKPAAPGSSQQQENFAGQDYQKEESLFAEPPAAASPSLVLVEILPSGETISTSGQSSNHNSSTGPSLAEADELAAQLKAKYKPNSREMAGKERSVFEEVERNVGQCYAANRDQPLKCEKMFREYKNYVELQRKQVLKRSLDAPLIATILVIVSCILLHITTVSCFGAMSIDLGSEWMKVGLVAPSVQMDIVLNAQSQRKTAMAIAFLNGERFVGDTAMDVASKYPEKTYTHFLDLVGKSLDHQSVEHYKQRFPHANITSHAPNSTSILLNHPEGLSFTPLELIAMMLQHAHDQVVNVLNNNEPASDVVITVPPFFSPIERRVILDAAKLAGLNVLRLTNVNSAFALSYGIFRHKDYLPESSSNTTSIIFFDQGASQTSATLADYHLIEQIDPITRQSKNESLPTVTIRAQVYDRYLGGFDMQLKLRNYLVKSFAEKEKIDESRIFKRGRSSAKLLKESGRVKRVLSANTDHTVRVENVIDDKDLRQPITRQEFEAMNEEYMSNRIVQLLDRLFEMPSVSRDDPIESVIIVGGNTRTPRIQQVLMDYFKLDTLGKSINADEGAALAALYQAASLGRGFRVKKFVLEEFGDERLRFDPAKVITTTTTTTTPAPTQETTAESVNGQEEASTTVASVTPEPTTSTTTTTTTTTTEAPTTPDPNAIYSESELTRMKKKLSKLRHQDNLRMQRLSLRNSLESLLSQGREKLSDDENQVPQKEEAQRKISETANWLEDASKIELENITLLAEKYHIIYQLVFPPPPLPPPTEEPSAAEQGLNLSNILNGTLNIMEALNFTNPFARQGDAPETVNATDAPVQDQATTEATTGATTEATTEATTTTATATPVDKRGPPPHSEL